MNENHDNVKGFEEALSQSKAGTYVLRLYVVGTSPVTTRAVRNIQALCDQHLKGRYDLEVIDITQEREAARKAQLVAAPTLIKELPPPVRKFIGDMSSTEVLLVGLDLKV